MTNPAACATRPPAFLQRLGEVIDVTLIALAAGGDRPRHRRRR
jgi:hypothetical protein